MSGKQLSPADDAAIFAHRRAGKSYALISELTGHAKNTVMRVLNGRKKRRIPRGMVGPCVECDTERGPFFHRGGGIRCVKCAARAVSRAKGRKV